MKKNYTIYNLRKKNNLKTFLRFISTLLLPTVIFTISCENENTNIEPEEKFSVQTFTFSNFNSKEKIKCYDIHGNTYDSVSYIYSLEDFTTNTSELFYNKIDINPDSLVNYYQSNDTLITDTGSVTKINDTLCFLNSNQLIQFKGTINNNQLNIFGYGTKIFFYAEDGINSMKQTSKITGYNMPPLDYLLSKIPRFLSDDFETKFQNMYLQKFNLVYDIETSKETY